MTRERRLVLDANILIRAVLGRRVRQIIETHAGHCVFFAPDVAFADARRHLPAIVRKRVGDDAAIDRVLAVLDVVSRTVIQVEVEAYESRCAAALARIETRDPDDWPILATAMVLDCPIWTEDNDFFAPASRPGPATASSSISEATLTESSRPSLPPKACG